MENKWINVALQCVSAVVMGVIAYKYLPFPFTNHDVVIYKIIGEGILYHGQFPYTYAFDHKPAFLFYIYAIATAIYPFKMGFFVFLSSIFYIVSGAVLSKYADGTYRNTMLYALSVTVLSLPFVDFSGNTEILYNSMILISLYALRSDRGGLIFISGLVAILSVNTNYLSGVILSLPTLYLLFSDGIHSALRKCIIYSLGVIVGLSVVFVPIIATSSITENYFGPQISFLSVYGSEGTYTDTLMHFLPGILLSSIFMTPAIVACIINNRRKDAITSLLLFSSVIISMIAPRQMAPHYFAMVVVPICMSLVIINKIRVMGVVIAMSIFSYTFSNDVRTMRRINNDNAVKFREGASAKFDELKRIVDGRKVLSIRSSHVPVYMADIYPVMPFIWNAHTKLVFRDKEEEFFVAELKKSPELVMTSNFYCDKPTSMQRVCSILKNDYTLIYRIEWGFGFGSDLYQYK